MMLTMPGQVSELDLRLMTKFDVIIIPPPHHLLAPPQLEGVVSGDVINRDDHGRIDF